MGSLGLFLTFLILKYLSKQIREERFSLIPKHNLVYIAGSRWDKHLSYVALSRHKESCHIFTDKHSYKNIPQLSEQLNKKSLNLDSAVRG